MPLLDGLKVILSGIHGYGVITTRPFKKGEVICYGDGVLYKEDDDFDDTYALVLPGEDSGLGEQFFWDLACQTRWFNHSCDPNSEVQSKWDHEAKTVRAWWVALRDIAVGEEILYDYAFVGEVAEPCACGAPTCRGLIVDPDPAELAKVPEHLRRLLRLQAA
jgi:SET domain